jgi:hypothetical protein
MPERTSLRAALRRRTVLRWGAGAGVALRAWPALAQGAPADGPEPPRLALLIGNREYPDGEDLPPIHKNVRDLRAVLEMRGFQVTDGVDLSLAQARQLLAQFNAQVRAAPADATVFFYFSGHGAQVDAENILVSAGLSPKARADLLIGGSMTLTRDVIGQLPVRPDGLTLTVLDACRTSLRPNAEGDGLNQVEAPPGCLIAFATRAGRPAIAPASDSTNTFYTASLVKLLASASGETPFQDLFRLVKADTYNTMINHPVQILRRFAQESFIADNARVRRRLAPRIPDAPPPPPRKEEESVAWARLEKLVWPADVAREAEAYLAQHPDSQLAGSAQVARDGAKEAATILRRNDVQLFRSAFRLTPDLPPEVADDILKAGRGDKDAAARMGQRLVPRTGYAGSGADNQGRYEGWMQYAAALGNGIASYRLALYYRRVAQPQLASQYEALARSLGYTPPPSLDNQRK